MASINRSVGRWANADLPRRSLEKAEALPNIRQPDHSGLMPANLTTLAHFSVSSAMSLPKSAGEPASRLPPSSASRALILESASAALVSPFSLSAIAAGVALGAPKPHQLLSS